MIFAQCFGCPPSSVTPYRRRRCCDLLDQRRQQPTTRACIVNTVIPPSLPARRARARGRQRRGLNRLAVAAV